MKKITFFLFAAICSLQAFSQATIIGHRGASYLAPENTLASANLAWELGADAVEIDVYLSKDGKVVVRHDSNTKRTSGESHVVKDTDSAVLRKLDVGSWKDAKYKGERIPFVEEVIATIPPGKTLVVEIKCGSEVLPALKKAVDESGKKDQITFISFGWKTICDTKKAFPDNRCYWLSETSKGLEKRMEQSKENGLDGVNLAYKIVDQKVMDKANELGLGVITWTVDDPKEARRLIDMGVIGITTNRPAWMKEQLSL